MGWHVAWIITGFNGHQDMGMEFRVLRKYLLSPSQQGLAKNKGVSL